MAEYLHHLLSAHSLFNISVQRPQRRLLGLIKSAAPHGDKPGGLHHNRNHQNGNQGQPDIGIYHQTEGSYDIDHDGNNLHHGIIEHFTHRIHIVGKAAHDISVVIGIIKTHRQPLDFGKKLIPYFKNSLLGYTDHNAGLEILGHNAEQINTGHDQQGTEQLLCAAIHGCQSVYNGAQHIGAGKHGYRIDDNTGKNQHQLIFLLLYVGKQPFHCFSGVLGLSPGHTASSGAARPFCRLCLVLLGCIGIFPGQRFFSIFLHDAPTCLSIWE